MTDTDETEETSKLLTQATDTSKMEAHHDHQVAKRFKLLYGISLVLGLVLVVLVFIWVIHYRGGLAWSDQPNIEFNWHPLLMVMALVFLYAQSMLIYRVARYKMKKSLKLCHAAIHCAIFILAVIALIAVFDSHNLAQPKPIPNMYSLHSWIGLITVILFACQFVAGFISFLFPGFPKELRAAYMHVHTSFGAVGFLFALISCVMGLTEKAFFNPKYSSKGSESMIINFIGIFLVFFGALVLYLVNESSYKRVPLPEDDLLLSSSHQETTE